MIGFEIFAQALYNVLGRGMPDADFSRYLFDRIYDKPEILSENPLDSVKPSSYKNFLWGHAKIDNLCKKIRADLNLEKFASFLRTPNSPLNRKLFVKVFTPYISDIDENNCIRYLTSLFFYIIQNAAGYPEAKIDNPSFSMSEIDAQQDLDFFGPPSSFSKRLLLEANYHCPFFNCRHNLYITRGTTTVDWYKAVLIDDSLSPDDYGNTLAMCPECATLYKIDHTPIEVEKLKDKKRDMVASFEANEQLSSQKIVEGIERLLRKAGSIEEDQLNKQITEPVEIRNKIEKKYVSLLISVNALAVNYFNDIQAIQKQLEEEGVFNFDEFKGQIHAMYVSKKMQALPQPQIFNSLSQWLSDSTGEDLDIARAVISYFIQICDVFEVQNDIS